jgi:ApaG protein
MLVMSFQYTLTTKSIEVQVLPQYIPQESMPDSNMYVWGYHITIKNKGKKAVQLVNRRWEITDERGLTAIVEGEGVVGKQPIINPKEKFEYSSGTHLNTPSGMMQGHFEMREADGRKMFNVDIPVFSLDRPGAVAN